MKILTSLILILLSQLAFPSTDLVLIGDSGKDNEGQRKVSRSIEEFCRVESCNLGAMAGDNVYPEGVSSEQDPILERMFDQYYNSLNIPFLVSLGNHDYGKFTNDWKRGHYQLLHALRNPLYHLPHYYFIHETEEAVFAVIDTTRLMWRKETFTQADMVEEAWKRSLKKGKWFIVLGHHPYLSNGRHGNAGNYERLKFPYFVSGTNVRAFLNANVCGKAHFYLAGHDHNLQVLSGSQKGCDTELVVSGSAATVKKLTNRNKATFQAEALGFFHLSINKNSVKLRAVDEEAKVLFEKNYLMPASSSILP